MFMSASLSSAPAGDAPGPERLHCRLCGQEHRLVPCERGGRLVCARCGGLLAKSGWFGRDAALAFTLAAFVLAVPAFTLPMVTVDKLRGERVGYVVTGAEALWDGGMPFLATWVLLCGTLAPLLLLGTLVALLVPPRVGWPPAAANALARAARALERWSMPEVHVLAVLVALTKLGTLVHVTVEPGFWCYAAMTLLAVVAWRNFEFGPPPAARTAGATATLPG